MLSLLAHRPPERDSQTDLQRASAVVAYIDSFLALIPANQYHGGEVPEEGGASAGAGAGASVGAGALAAQSKFAKHTRNPAPEQPRKEASKKGLKRQREADARAGGERPRLS